MKSSEVKKLLGMQISWSARNDLFGKMYPPLKSGQLLEVKGKSLLVNVSGTPDWHWLPDMMRLRKSGDLKVNPASSKQVANCQPSI